MRVLVFRHSPSETLGYIADALAEHGIDYQYSDLYAFPEQEFPVTEADALILMGGAMSVNDGLPYLGREIAHIREFISRGRPVLGVCLGAQLIAKALGASVRKNPVKEIGWEPIRWNPAAGSDPIFAGLSGPLTVFHWHGETFDLPGGAELLASSEGCRNQAFRAGDRVYGLQFHLEVTPEMIAQWCREDEACGDRREAAGPIDPYAHAARSQELAHLVFGRWCALLKGAWTGCAARS